MKFMRRLRGTEFLAAACAVSFVALGLSLRPVSAQTRHGDEIGGRTITGTVGGRVAASNSEIRFGPRLSLLRNIPSAEPIIVDYRKDDIAVVASSSKSALINIGSRDAGSSSGDVSAAATSHACRQDAQCNDCDPCTLDDCGTHSCQGGDRDGFSCDPDDNDCGGKCVGGINTGCPDGICDFDTQLCVGGGNGGGSCSPQACFSKAGCCGDAGVGGAIADGTCTLFACTELTPPKGGGNQCINALIPVGLFVPDSECDDALECNGGETCSAGACVAGDPLCAPETNTLCDEDEDSCLPPCVDDS